MDVFSVISLLGGLAFFLYGMNTMSAGLEKMVGSKLESVLKTMTSNRFKGLLLGAVVTAVIQSSSAVTVMLVGLVNSGIMKFSQSIGVIMGTNIGTTITAWILSLSGIESDNMFIRLLKPESFAPVFALIGIIFISFVKNQKKKDLGSIFLGFALLMTGMSMMSSAMKPLADSPEFANILLMFSNPVFGILVGIGITALIQSSSASVGILQSLANTGAVTYGTAIPIIMGQNIGTCITSLISSIGTNKKAKRVTAVHILFNVIGTVVLMTIYFVLNAIFKFAFANQPVNAMSIAVIHSAFNIITTVMLFPFGNQLNKLAHLIIKDSGTDVDYELLDERLLVTPSFAIAECKNVTTRMAKVSHEAISTAIDLIYNFDPKKVQLINEFEEQIDFYEDKLGSYLVKLSSKSLTVRDSNEVAELLHAIGDFERIGDHAINLAEVAEEISQKKIFFSEEASNELRIITDAVKEILSITFTAFESNDISLAAKVEPLEQVIDGLKLELKNRHVKRLQSGKCTIELGFVLSDILANYERVSDHCSNIAVYILQIENADIEAHEYLAEIKQTNNELFTSSFNNYKETYSLPKQAKAVTAET